MGWITRATVWLWETITWHSTIGEILVPIAALAVTVALVGIMAREPIK